MKNVFTLLFLVSAFLFGKEASAQVTCDSVAGICADYLKESTGNRIFISDGQVYRAFLQDDESAEFNTTFFGGSTYRLAVSAGERKDYVIFEVYDQQGNLLFSNSSHKNAHYWDFRANSTMDCRIVTRLDPEKKSTGCAIMLMGFQKKN